MRKTGSIAVVFGLAALLGLGAVSSPARQDEPKAKEEVSAKKALRERVIALRTEVELLQIEHDADRIDLVETLAEHRTLLRKGLQDETKELAAVERRLRKSIDMKKIDFTRRSRELNEKKLDLEDVEKRYSQTR